MRQSASIREINRLMSTSARLYHQLAQSAGMPDAAFSMLYALADLDGICCQSDLCIVTGLPKQTVHSAVRQLQQEGLLILEKGVGRRRMVRLTEKGRQLLEEKIAPAVQAEEAAFGTLTRAEQRLLISLMHRYLAQLQLAADRM